MQIGRRHPKGGFEIVAPFAGSPAEEVDFWIVLITTDIIHNRFTSSHRKRLDENGNCFIGNAYNSLVCIILFELHQHDNDVWCGSYLTGYIKLYSFLESIDSSVRHS